MTTLANCSYEYDTAVTLGDALIDVDFAMNIVYGIYACTPFKWEYAVNLLLVVVWLVVARWMYDGYMRIRGKAHGFTTLANELTKKDNPALAIDFASFLLSICLITRGSADGLQPAIDNARYFGGFVLYQAVGCVTLLVARVLNDALMLRKVGSVEAMIKESSVAVACVQAGATLATAIIFSASASGLEPNFAEGVGATMIYWAIGQVFLVIYGNLVDVVTALPMVSALSTELVPTGGASSSGGGPDGGDEPGTSTAGAEASTNRRKGATSILKEAAAGNVAAGLSIFFDLVHAGIVIAAPIYVGYSVLAWLVYVLTTLLVVSPVMHLYLDHIIMRGASYTTNILRHKNWGAAVLMGAQKVLLAFVLMYSYRENCSPSTLYAECIIKEPDEMLAALAIVSLPNVFTWQVLFNMLLLLLLIGFAKFVYFLRLAFKDGVGNAAENMRQYSLDETLADPNNNAVSISLAAYTFATGLAAVGIVTCPDENPGLHAGFILLWTAIGSALLFVAFVINDYILLIKISNTDMLIANNLAVATFEAGSFLACGAILRTTLTGGGYSIGDGLALTCIYWLLSQALLLVFAYVYRFLTFFDDWEALRTGNVASGVSGGITLVALAVVMSYPIMYYSSIIIFLPITLVGILALMIVRQLVDKFLMPGDSLDHEIVNDKNWGAALIEGAVALGIAFISNNYVPPPGAPFVSEDIDYFDVCD